MPGTVRRRPVAVIYPDGVFYEKIKAEDAAEVVEQHVLKGRVVERLVSKERSGKSLATSRTWSFSASRSRSCSAIAASIDPMRIEEYVARDGYQALAKVLQAG